MNHLIPYIILFGLILLISVIIGLRRYRKYYSQGSITIPLKEYGDKIKVDIDKCEIITKEYYEDQTSDKFPSRMDMIDSLYRSSGGAEKTKKTVSVIVYKNKDQDGHVIEYRSEPIFLPGETIRYIFLNNNKAPTLYIDP